ncbi:hypothetical protein [Salinihabitans flavidus]|nr:hypothetical protein [Salinihabitans flavidus]
MERCRAIGPPDTNPQVAEAERPKGDVEATEDAPTEAIEPRDGEIER